MFNDKYGLTKAVLEGKKTQTRRLFSKHNFIRPFGNFCEGKLYVNEVFKDGEISKYAVGEVLAVAQNYSEVMDHYNSLGHISTRQVSEKELIFWSEMRRMESTGDDSAMQGDGNKMFVRADLMPFQIRITNIRFEHIQDISNDDCLKEGIKKSWWMDSSGKYLYGFGEHEDKWKSPKEAYAALIDRISGKGTWEKNPWVFVYDFELVK